MFLGSTAFVAMSRTDHNNWCGNSRYNLRSTSQREKNSLRWRAEYD